MDEARRVIRRLERIESLQRSDAPAGRLLAEVRALLREGEAWLAVEDESAGEAAGPLGRCRALLEPEGEVRLGKQAEALL